MRKTVLFQMMLVLIFCTGVQAENEWPKEITTSQATVVIYQPQPEELNGNKLEARAAISLELKDDEMPLFGAIWFESRLETDRVTRMATILDVVVSRVRFPDDDAQRTMQLKSLLEREIPKWALEISMDRLMTSLETTEQRIKDAGKLNMAPPKVIFVNEPAILINIDGEPRLQKEEGGDVQRVVNTPFTLLFDPQTKIYYLYADKESWYTALDIKGEWRVTQTVPSEVAKLAPQAEVEDSEETGETEQSGPPPKIIVETEPAELISCTGKFEFAAIPGTNLLYLTNTDSDVLMDIQSQLYYILLAGRWYVSGSTDGPWEYVPGEKLPADFAKIPEESDMETVLYAVPGTDAAKDAVLDAQIPQTASIEREKADLTVEYDGTPKFEAIKGTRMTYAVNTVTPVIYCQSRFYACDEAVWFVAATANGPWTIATTIPNDIYTVPPDCPVYNVTFVRIYGSTPNVVYVGYTPGYTHTYVYHSTVVYGTGYYWSGWYGRYYYPRPCTWGYHVRYSPRWGWSFGFSYCYGPYRFAIGYGVWYRGSWWGPGYYRGYHHGYRHGYRHGFRTGLRVGYRVGQRHPRHDNLYRSQRNQHRVRPMTNQMPSRAKAGVANNRANNVYADKRGNVHRRTDQGWQSRTGEGWQNQRPQQNPSTQQRQQQQAAQRLQQQRQQQLIQQRQQQQAMQQRQQQLNRAYQARQRGNQRVQPQQPSGGRR